MGGGVRGIGGGEQPVSVPPLPREGELGARSPKRAAFSRVPRVNRLRVVFNPPRHFFPAAGAALGAAPFGGALSSGGLSSSRLSCGEKPGHGVGSSHAHDPQPAGEAAGGNAQGHRAGGGGGPGLRLFLLLALPTA